MKLFFLPFCVGMVKRGPVDKINEKNCPPSRPHAGSAFNGIGTLGCFNKTSLTSCAEVWMHEVHGTLLVRKEFVPSRQFILTGRYWIEMGLPVIYHNKLVIPHRYGRIWMIMDVLSRLCMLFKSYGLDKSSLHRSSIPSSLSLTSMVVKSTFTLQPTSITLERKSSFITSTSTLPSTSMVVKSSFSVQPTSISILQPSTCKHISTSALYTSIMYSTIDTSPSTHSLPSSTVTENSVFVLTSMPVQSSSLRQSSMFIQSSSIRQMSVSSPLPTQRTTTQHITKSKHVKLRTILIYFFVFFLAGTFLLYKYKNRRSNNVNCQMDPIYQEVAESEL